ncbi:7-carboxy-7-deazaguanine synthase QueE [Frankia sp. B2]|uniref:7-carboxy-7-deazaguanine synthase QueE n=1 Tax=Frankia sp. B2 TaxID=2541730 RepID=UPI00106AE4E1|nr:7-carboxy-7-deazaguanine synthase QueE [Frankia sp. B2]TFE26211.1 7-carboxy-7-deazaguanine synthase QueE [Frankia sp. B2]
MRASPGAPPRAATSRGLVVVERFGPTFQGEGPTAGQRALFIRLSACNLSCVWCDEPHTWDRNRFDVDAHSERLSQRTLLGWALDSPVTRVVVTGGEPLLQQSALFPLVAALAQAGRQVEIETNGTVAPTAEMVEVVERFTVSPKLSGSRVAAGRRIVPAALTAFAGCGKAVFKFVVSADGEIDEIAELEGRFGLSPVWVMPEGTDEPNVLAGMRRLAEIALERGWNLSPRLHVLLWGNARGH